MLKAKPAPEPAKSADHLVDAKQNPVFLANGADARPIAGRRNDDAARALHGLADESCDIFGPHFEDPRLERVRSACGELLRSLAETLHKPVRLHDMLDAGYGQIALCVHGLHAAQAPASRPPAPAPATVEPW